MPQDIFVKNSTTTVHLTKETLNTNFIVSCRNELVLTFTIFRTFQHVHTTPNFGIHSFVHCGLQNETET